MASAAEQLAANINFGAFAKATELKRRLWFTLGALVIYRLGTYIPVPGVDPSILGEIFQQNQSGILGMFNMFAGGALGRMTIFALGVMPYISASIIIQLMTTVSPHIAQLKKEGEAGRKKINQYTRYGTVILAALQGLRDRGWARGDGRGLGQRGHRGRPVLPRDHRDHAHRRDHILDVAGRANHRPGRRQRYLVDHILGHRRRVAAGLGEHARTRAHGRAVDRDHLRAAGLGRCRDHVHRLYRASAATNRGSVPQAPGRSTDVRRRELAPAAQAEHLGCHSADLRLPRFCCCR